MRATGSLRVHAEGARTFDAELDRDDRSSSSSPGCGEMANTRASGWRSVGLVADSVAIPWPRAPRRHPSSCSLTPVYDDASTAKWTFARKDDCVGIWPFQICRSRLIPVRVGANPPEGIGH